MIRKIIPLCVLVMMMTRYSFGGDVKDPNVAGQFYDANPRRLSAQIDEFLAAAQPSDKDIRIVIAPHAGYVFSGWVAAYGYKAVSRRPVKTVVILAPSHYFGFDKASVWSEGKFRTPLGEVEVDGPLSRKLLDSGTDFIDDRRVFAQEHALEVQIPFLQKIYPDIKIVPIIMGQCGRQACQEMARQLHNAIGQREDVLVVVSSDMSHFHTDAQARQMDHRALEAIAKSETEKFWKECQSRRMEMCGFVPVTTALYLAELMGLRPEVLKYATSGDVTGDLDRVVGYGAVIFYKTAQAQADPPAQSAVEGVAALTPQQKKTLLNLARETIELYIRTGKVREVSESDPRLLEPEGAFVTIHKRGQLRGCIGHIVSDAPLCETVRDMAIAAASSDPRFRPVTEAELADIDLEISVLSKPRRTRDPQEITMGVHGVIVRRGFHQGVFLPQVATETGWNREEFLSNLCAHKAGLAPDAWKDPNTRLEIFTADVFAEKDF